MKDINIQPHEVEPITNTENIIDSRDVQERIDYIKSLKGMERVTDGRTSELHALLELKNQYINDYGDSSWDFGAVFIRDTYFEDYAQELAEDCGMVNSDTNWPNNHIDWTAAANELLYDYTEVVFDGVTYYTREA